MIDTHTHIYLSEFDIDQDLMFQRAKHSGVEYMLLPNIEQQTFNRLQATTNKNDNVCKAMMGLHPCSVKENYKNELEFVRQELFKNKSLHYFGVGEIGLDYYWDLTFKSQQEEVFKQQLIWATDLKLPVSIHSRNATQNCIDIVSLLKNKNLNGVFHCFSGTVNEAIQIIDLGFYFGIGGVVTFKKSGLDEVLKNIPIQNIVLETDAPYLAPVPYRGKRNEPAYLEEISKKLSEIYNLPIEEIKNITSATARKIFNL